MKTITRTIEERLLKVKVYSEEKGVNDVDIRLYDVKDSDVEKEIKAALKQTYPDAIYLNTYYQVQKVSVTRYMNIDDFIEHSKSERGK